MNVRHSMGVLHSFSIKNIFYNEVDLRLFYFDVVIYSCQNDIKILEDLRYHMVTLLRWFKEYSVKVNSKIFRLMILGKTPRQPIMLNINQIR